MTIFRLNFLLKVGQMKVCQNPSFISTLVVPSCCRDYLGKFILKTDDTCSKVSGEESQLARSYGLLKEPAIEVSRLS